MSKFPDVLEKVYQMNNSDLNVVGEHLGYEWNDICDAVSEEGLYAQDGDGAINVSRAGINRYKNPKIKHIFSAIFEHYKEVREISIVNN